MEVVVWVVCFDEVEEYSGGFHYRYWGGGVVVVVGGVDEEGDFAYNPFNFSNISSCPGGFQRSKKRKEGLGSDR